MMADFIICLTQTTTVSGTELRLYSDCISHGISGASVTTNTGPFPAGYSAGYGGSGGLSRSGNAIRRDFGNKAIGPAGESSTNADGYYRVEIDFEGDGLTDALMYFYRYLRDVNGIRGVNKTDAYMILIGWWT